MRNLFFLLLLSTTLFAQKNNPDKQDWKQLFNGKNLDGWDIKIAGQPLNDNYKNTFRVEDDMIRIVYDEYKTFDDKFGHMYYKTPYSHYIFNYEYRFTGNQTPGGAVWNVRNSGVMFHSQSAESLTYNQTFPVSLEMQLLGGLGKDPRYTGNLCTPGTQVYIDVKFLMEHCIDSDSKTYDGDQWVKASLIVLGDSIVHQVIEGDTVLTFQKLEIGGDFVDKNSMNWKVGGFTEEAGKYWDSLDGTPLKEGYISLQAESHPIDF
ncbi:MAG: DUF1080 domain-containing protein, partial [Spirosomataceae bacterium]